jgi:hypothetical protein
MISIVIFGISIKKTRNVLSIDIKDPIEITRWFIMKKRRTKINCDLLSPVEIFKLVLTEKLEKFPNRFWSNSDAIENAVEILRYLFESILQWSSEDIKKNCSKSLFKEYKLQTMFHGVFHGSPFRILNAAYPNQFKEWELKITPNNFWNEETGIKATKWLIEEKLKWTGNDIKEKISGNVFIQNGLEGMLQIVYHDSVWQAINAAYPNQFKEWELKNTPRNFWNKETAIKATKWLIEDKLKWTEKDIKEKLNIKVFYNNGLSGMINILNSSVWQAINITYPNHFKEWELKITPNHFWNKETAIMATKWLIEEKLKWTDHEIKEYLQIQTFRDHGLSTVINTIYNNSPYKALNAAYPGRFHKNDFRNRKHIKSYPNITLKTPSS